MNGTFWITRTFFTVTIPLLVVMFALFLIACGVIILRFGGVEEGKEVMLVLSLEDRSGVDLGPLKELAKIFIVRTPRPGHAAALRLITSN
ncbi:hypothetical protein GCM10027435_04350 [Haloparvum alkalitolerans]|uniref:hypothetical protein n=1 Tax=Haloparvum alkalitolerans TaxID=1042953 RepID=UPI003CF31EB7